MISDLECLLESFEHQIENEPRQTFLSVEATILRRNALVLFMLAHLLLLSTRFVPWLAWLKAVRLWLTSRS